MSFPKIQSIDNPEGIVTVFRCLPFPDAHRIIALFPLVPGSITNHNDECLSYDPVTGFLDVQYEDVIKHSQPCNTPQRQAEAGVLATHLRGRGFDLEVAIDESVSDYLTTDES